MKKKKSLKRKRGDRGGIRNGSERKEVENFETKMIVFWNKNQERGQKKRNQQKKEVDETKMKNNFVLKKMLTKKTIKKPRKTDQKVEQQHDFVNTRHEK